MRSIFVALGAFAVSIKVALAGCPVLDETGEPQLPASAHVSLVCHAGYAVAVDNDALVPQWVAYRLTGDHTLGCLARESDFHTEEELVGRRAEPSDYHRSGYDRGHQAPAEDFAWNEDEESDSFSMANMAPQLPGLNRAEWERLEETVRAWAWGRGGSRRVRRADHWPKPTQDRQGWRGGPRRIL